MTKTPASAAKTSSVDKTASGEEQEQKIDAGLVREIASLLSDSDLTEIEVEKGDLRIRVARQSFVSAAPQGFYPPPPAPIAAPTPSLAAPVEAASDSADVLKSPMVGTAYLRPSPDAKPFVEIGAHVTAGQKLLLVEAMKTFNDIVAHKSGVISALLVEDAQPVEYGQPLAVIS